MDGLEHRHMNRVRKRLASCYGLEVAPLTCSSAFLVGLALRTPSAIVGTADTRKVRVQ